jgi:hypothetical protein
MTVATTETYLPTAPTPHSPGANLIREAAAVMVDAHALAKAICNTQMVPKHFQGRPDECAAAMLYGASLGFDPMQSVRQIYVVHGQAALYARAMVSLVLGNGHEVWTVESTDESVTVAAKRRGSERTESATWTFERAKKAGYTNNEKYRTDPQAMLYSKAASEVCRKVAPDVLSGVYAVEELEADAGWAEPSRTVERPGGLAAALAAPVVEVVPPELEESATEPEPLLLNVRSNLAKAMYASINEAGIPEVERVAWVGNVIGRDITSTKEMTEDEARVVLNHLAAPTADPEGAGRG